jgi:hypothetical protein
MEKCCGKKIQYTPMLGGGESWTYALCGCGKVLGSAYEFEKGAQMRLHDEVRNENLQNGHIIVAYWSCCNLPETEVPSIEKARRQLELHEKEFHKGKPLGRFGIKRKRG